MEELNDEINLDNYYIGDSIFYSNINDNIIPNTINNIIIRVKFFNNIISYQIIGRLDLKTKKIDKSYSSEIVNKTIYNFKNNSCIYELNEDFVNISEEWLFSEKFVSIESFSIIKYINVEFSTQYVSSKYILYKKN